MFRKKISRWIPFFDRLSDRGVLYKLTEDNRLYFDNGCSLWWNVPGNFEIYIHPDPSDNPQLVSQAGILSVGKVKAIHSIRSIPATEFTHEVASVKGYGYWIRMVSRQGTVRSVRLWIEEDLFDFNHQITGVLIRFEEQPMG